VRSKFPAISSPDKFGKYKMCAFVKFTLFFGT